MDCAHNFIRITASTLRPPPYDFCSKCGVILEVPQPTALRPPVVTSTIPMPNEALAANR